ncbi:MAG: DUF4230 domain-containing protein [Chloroflexota bacterium]
MSQRETPPTEEIIPHPGEQVVIVRQADADEPRQTRSGCLWGVAGAVGCVALLLVIPVTLILLGVTSVNGLIGSIGGLFGVGAPPQAVVLSTQTIVQGIQPMGQLVSVSAKLAKADVQVNINQGTLNACGFGANHVVQGAVEAGIDLTRIDEANLGYDAERETYVLLLPAPQLTSCRIDYIRQYSRSFTTCSVDWDEARLLANYMALNDFRDDSVEGGILDRAESETRLVLGNFIQMLTGHPVEIVFQEPEEPILPASCVPETPQGWTFNPAGNLWTK